MRFWLEMCVKNANQIISLAKTFTLCTKLHNMCIDRHIYLNGELIEEDDDVIDGDLGQQDNGANAVAARIAVINLF